MDKNFNDLLETVIFIKENMVTKDDHNELVARVDRLENKVDVLRGDTKAGFTGVMNRTGGLDNRIDNETFARKDLENRVRVVLPNLPHPVEQV